MKQSQLPKGPIRSKIIVFEMYSMNRAGFKQAWISIHLSKQINLSDHFKWSIFLTTVWIEGDFFLSDPTSRVTGHIRSIKR